ncbi:sugar ABC transporter substrate-binding protein [Microbacterium schleiferi]|uniref:sugar ABC transporter substrate-binding protein n=1 Tax=Microbacterium schleiferi TaxID=69362 RepID=UPI00311F2DF5
MRTSIKAFAAATAVAALALAGCSSGGGDNGGGDTEPTKVVAFTSGNQTPIGAWWVKDVEAKAAEYGWDLTMIQGDFDFQKMNPAVESAIGQGADVVFDGFTDIASIASISTAAKDAGIPMFAVDSGTEPNDAFALNITTDQQGIVDQTMGATSDAIGGLEGKTIMVIGHDPHAGIRMRSQLAAEAVEAAGATLAGGEIQQVVSPATGRTGALALVADYLAANPNGLDAVWVGWDDAALGAVQAVSEAGASAVVTGCDATSEALAAIEAGTMLATVEQPWPLVNASVVDAITAYLESGTMPSSNFDAVATTLVTKANAAEITPSDKLG